MVLVGAGLRTDRTDEGSRLRHRSGRRNHLYRNVLFFSLVRRPRRKAQTRAGGLELMAGTTEMRVDEATEMGTSTRSRSGPRRSPLFWAKPSMTRRSIRIGSVIDERRPAEGGQEPLRRAVARFVNAAQPASELRLGEPLDQHVGAAHTPF